MSTIMELAETVRAQDEAVSLPPTDPLAILLADIMIPDARLMREIEQSIYDHERARRVRQHE